MRRRRISPLLDELSRLDQHLVLTKLHVFRLRIFIRRKLLPTMLLGVISAYYLLACTVLILALTRQAALLMAAAVGMFATVYVFGWLVEDWLQRAAKRSQPYRVLQ